MKNLNKSNGNSLNELFIGCIALFLFFGITSPSKSNSDDWSSSSTFSKMTDDPIQDNNLEAMENPLQSCQTQGVFCLKDQNGNEISQSQLLIYTNNGNFVFQQGDMVNVPDGTYNIRLYPGIDGTKQINRDLLWREDTIMVVNPAIEVYDYTFHTGLLELDLEDQHFNQVDQTQFRLFGISLNVILPNNPIALPITNPDGLDPDLIDFHNMGGSLINGYNITVYPGINGATQFDYLKRKEEFVEVFIGDQNNNDPRNEYTFTWELGELEIHVVDQNDQPIPQTQLLLPSVGVGFFPPGASLTLPVTTSADNGSLDNGYNLRIFPGVNGVAQSSVVAREVGDANDPEVLNCTGTAGSGAPVVLVSSGTDMNDPIVTKETITWKTVDCPLKIVTPAGQGVSEVPGSSARIPLSSGYITWNTGDNVVLPVNDPDEYCISPGSVAGYEVEFLIPPSTQFQAGQPMILDQNGIFAPAFVDIGGIDYGLSYEDCSPSCLNWAEEAKLLASDGAKFDYFGDGVAMNGDRAIIGAAGDDDNGANAGAAYIFQWDGSTWIELQKLTTSDGANGDEIGRSVSMDGDRTIIGAARDDDNGNSSGSAYIFQWDGSNWIEQQKLTASDAAKWDNFGISVSIDSDRAIIGAYLDDDNGKGSGSAYIFQWDGSNWIELQKLTASDGTKWDLFGIHVSIKEDRAIIGASRDGDNGKYSGSAYIFQWDGSSWIEQQKLTASDGAKFDYFGESVSIDGDRAIIGAYSDDDNGNSSGSAYIFQWDGSNWIEQQKLTASDAANGDKFGKSVSIDSDQAIIGASGSGSAYIFQWDGSNWIEQQKLTASDGGGGFGLDASIDGDRAIIGADGDDDNGNNSGSAYIYSCLSSSFSEEITSYSNGEIAPQQNPFRLGEDNQEKSIEKGQITIYPNPTTSVIQVTGLQEPSEFQMFDLTGRIIKTGIIQNNRIILSEFGDGLYYLSISSGDQKIIKKVVKH